MPNRRIFRLIKQSVYLTGYNSLPQPIFEEFGPAFSVGRRPSVRLPICSTEPPLSPPRGCPSSSIFLAEMDEREGLFCMIMLPPLRQTEHVWANRNPLSVSELEIASQSRSIFHLHGVDCRVNS